MLGTVKCRPTLAYGAHFDGINISDCTDYKILLNEKLAQCCFNVRLKSATLADIISTLGECAVLAGKALTANMLGVNCFQTPTVTQPFVPQHRAHMRELVNYSLIDVAQVYGVYMICELVVNAAMGAHIVLLSWLITVDVR